jgi:L-iditol 2-dehydrogenase
VGSRRWGAFAQYAAVPLTNLLTLPENLSFVEGALVEPASVALRAARHGQIGVGSSVTILGAGAIGLLVGLWAQAMGATLISVADINPARLEHARALGFDDVFDSRSGEYVEHIDALTQGKGVDIVFESAGSPITQRQAIEAVRPGGRAVFLGITHADLQLPEQVAESILRKEVCVQGSWAAYGNPFPGPDWMDTIEFMSTGRVDFSKIADWTGPLAEGPDIYQQFRDKTIHSTKIIFLPNEDSEGLPDVQQ